MMVSGQNSFNSRCKDDGYYPFGDPRGAHPNRYKYIKYLTQTKESIKVLPVDEYIERSLKKSYER